MKCKKCQGENLVMRPNAKNPSATELICGDCGTWQKFIGKEEIRLFEMHHQEKCVINSKTGRLIPDKWKLKTACCGVADSTAIYFEVITGTKGETEIMVMLSKKEFEQLQADTRFWEKQCEVSV